jgi:hypothetical protein
MSTDPNASTESTTKPPSMRRVAFASFVGTAIEYYDFYIYGTAAALIFPTVFFPNLSPTMATIASFATFAVAFFSRPVPSGPRSPVISEIASAARRL